MSNDLISRSALIESIKKWLPSDPCGKEQSMEEVVATDLSVSMLMEIEDEPTAYDLDAVCEKLKKLKNAEVDMSNEEPELADAENIYEGWRAQGRVEAYVKAVEIVRNGGKK